MKCLNPLHTVLLLALVLIPICAPTCAPAAQSKSHADSPGKEGLEEGLQRVSEAPQTDAEAPPAVEETTAAEQTEEQAQVAFDPAEVGLPGLIAPRASSEDYAAVLGLIDERLAALEDLQAQQQAAEPDAETDAGAEPQAADPRLAALRALRSAVQRESLLSARIREIDEALAELQSAVETREAPDLGVEPPYPLRLLDDLRAQRDIAQLARENILSDVFHSMAIILDKPFKVGDFVVAGDTAGVIDNIGVKTTRIRSLSGEMVVMSNTNLLGTTIRNFKHMRERRVVFKVGVVYQTTPEQLELIPKIIEEIIRAQPRTRFDRTHFYAYGDFSLDFEIVYYVLGADYSLYMDRQQEINLALYRRFQDEGIRFAYPTQEVFVRHLPPTSEQAAGASTT